MKLAAKICVVVGCSVIAVCARPLRADEATTDDASFVAGPIAAELNELGLEFRRLAAAAENAHPADGAVQTDEELSDEEWMEHGRAVEAKAPDPDTVMLPRLLAFAESHPSSPLAFDALFYLIRRGGPQTGDVHGKPWQTKEQALDVVWTNHMQDPRMVHLLGQLGGSLPSHKTESFLRRTLENSPDRNVQAAAAFNLAHYFRTLDRAHVRSQKLKEKAHLLNFERFWNIVVTPYLEENFPLDEEANSAEIERFLKLVIDDYSDAPATDWRLSGPSKIFIETVPFARSKTYGDLAKAMLFEINNMVPGKQAPEIEGTDSNGQRFRLSDYRGKVVLLTFSANWCEGCVELYPLQRKLLEKFRDQPFVILSVSRDKEIDTLKSSIESGDITWRCWWDGDDGPIREAWNSRGIPRLILLDDQQLFQDVAFSRYSSQDEFEQAIESLLRRIPAGNDLSP